MAQNKKITVEVAFAKPVLQHILTVQVDEDQTVREAIVLSGILAIFPEINLDKQKVGMFGKICNLSDRVKAGMRIEIYRPLIIDPKEARRKKAKITAVQSRSRGRDVKLK